MWISKFWNSPLRSIRERTIFLFQVHVYFVFYNWEKLKIGEEENFEILHGLDVSSVTRIFQLDCPYFDSQRGKSRLHTLYVCTHERRRPFRAFFFWWIDRKGQGDEADIRSRRVESQVREDMRARVILIL